MPNGQPNILVLWGDDIGISNLSCYSDGLMGYRTPNIDRIAGEGVRFTDYYGEQSCTAGRATFITGQNPYRTGLTKVGMPGADIGLRAEDPTIATALKAHGYGSWIGASVVWDNAFQEELDEARAVLGDEQFDRLAETGAAMTPIDLNTKLLDEIDAILEGMPAE